MKDDKLYLLSIQDCVRKIEAYTRGGREEFLRSSLTQDAVIRNFEVIGEASKQVSPSLKEAYPEIPWRRIAGFRDVLIHNYLGVDINEVWAIIRTTLPDLKRNIETILASLQQE